MTAAPTTSELAEGLTLALELVDRFGPRALCYVERMEREIAQRQASQDTVSRARQLLASLTEKPVQHAVQHESRRL